MARKKQNRASWFRMNLEFRHLVKAMSEESAGAALKAVYAYFDTGALPDNLDHMADSLFQEIRSEVDQSIEDYNDAVERGRRAANVRWVKEDTACIQGDTPCIDNDTEKDKDKEIEKDLYQEPEPPLRPLPKALKREMDFNDRRELALEKLRHYPA